jgi:beta-lactamase superfamily II metal-dependent hydrolase
MTEHAITLDVLPAGYGDCLLIQCPVGQRTWRMLVDTGPDETFPQLKARLAALPVDVHGKRHIDLFVVTHIDHDHIGGAGLLLSDRSLGLSFGDIWFKAPPNHLARGVAEGESLAGLLGAGNLPLPWNVAFGGKAAVSEGGRAFVELASSPGAPRLTLLSPTPDRLTDLFKVWDKELARLHNKESDKPEPAQAVGRGLEALDVPALAAKVTATDHSAANGSAIAVLLEHQGASVVLGADSFPTVLAPALEALARHRKVSGPLKVDAFKLSHHGSRANVTNELLAAVQADHYVFSTNNAIFNHPNDESVSRVLVHGGKQPTLWFNYATQRNRRWADSALRAKYGFEAKYPADGNAGVTLALPARSARSGRH